MNLFDFHDCRDSQMNFIDFIDFRNSHMVFCFLIICLILVRISILTFSGLWISRIFMIFHDSIMDFYDFHDFRSSLMDF